MSYSNTVTPTAGRTTIPEMANGDDLDATNQAEVSQALANRIELNYTRLIPLTTWHALVALGVEAEWAYDTGGWKGIKSATNNASEYCQVHLPGLVDGSVLTGWAVLVEGTGGYAATPAVVNEAQLWKRNMTTGAITAVGALRQDPATFGGTPDMTDVREISESGLTETIDLTGYTYFIMVEHEHGANALAGVCIHGARTTVTRPTT